MHYKHRLQHQYIRTQEGGECWQGIHLNYISCLFPQLFFDYRVKAALLFILGK